MKKLILIVLLFPSITLGLTNKDIYITTGCANNGDGTASTCAGSGGGAGAYNSCVNAESGERPTTDLQTDDIQIDFFFSQNGTTAAPDAGRCQFLQSNWGDGDATRYIHLQPLAGQEHSGVWDTTIYHYSDDQYYELIELEPDYSRITGLQLRQERTSTDGRSDVLILDGSFAKVERNLIFNDNLLDTTNVRNLRANNAEGIFIANNIVVGGREGVFVDPAGSSTGLVANNTIIESRSTGLTIERYDTGFASGTIEVRNNLIEAASGGTDFSDIGSRGTITTSNNFTSDATSPDGASYQSKTFTFEDSGSDDFHLASGHASGAKDGGADLSAHGTYPFSDDIDGETRSGTWDAGADEHSGGGGGSGSGLKLTIEQLDGIF